MWFSMWSFFSPLLFSVLLSVLLIINLVCLRATFFWAAPPMFPTWATCLVLLVCGLKLLLHKMSYSGKKPRWQTVQKVCRPGLVACYENCLACPLCCFLKWPLQRSVKQPRVVDFVVVSAHAINQEGKINLASESALYWNWVAISVHNLTLWGVNVLCLLEII